MVWVCGSSTLLKEVCENETSFCKKISKEKRNIHCIDTSVNTWYIFVKHYGKNRSKSCRI